MYKIDVKTLYEKNSHNGLFEASKLLFTSLLLYLIAYFTLKDVFGWGAVESKQLATGCAVLLINKYISTLVYHFITQITSVDLALRSIRKTQITLLVLSIISIYLTIYCFKILLAYDLVVFDTLLVFATFALLLCGGVLRNRDIENLIKLHRGQDVEMYGVALFKPYTIAKVHAFRNILFRLTFVSIISFIGLFTIIATL